VIAGIVGAVLGDSISFWLGQKLGPVLPRIWPFRTHPERLTRGIVFFERNRGGSVFVGRFFGPLRAVIPLVAGMMRMPMARFCVANILSAAVWAPALVFFGALLSRSLSADENVSTKIFYVALIALAGTALAYWVRRQFLVR
jgi:membrane protein DedA with SNARE-associated domain